MRRGVISDLGPAAEMVDAAALRAEKTTKAPIETAVVGVGGPHMRGMNSQGGINMGSRMKEITKEDVRAAIDRARSVSLAPDREVLHLLPPAVHPRRSERNSRTRSAWSAIGWK